MKILLQELEHRFYILSVLFMRFKALFLNARKLYPFGYASFKLQTTPQTSVNFGTKYY